MGNPPVEGAGVAEEDERSTFNLERQTLNRARGTLPVESDVSPIKSNLLAGFEVIELTFDSTWRWGDAPLVLFLPLFRQPLERGFVDDLVTAFEDRDAGGS